MPFITWSGRAEVKEKFSARAAGLPPELPRFVASEGTS